MVGTAGDLKSGECVPDDIAAGKAKLCTVEKTRRQPCRAVFNRGFFRLILCQRSNRTASTVSLSPDRWSFMERNRSPKGSSV